LTLQAADVPCLHVPASKFGRAVATIPVGVAAASIGAHVALAQQLPGTGTGTAAVPAAVSTGWHASTGTDTGRSGQSPWNPAAIPEALPKVTVALAAGLAAGTAYRQLPKTTSLYEPVSVMITSGFGPASWRWMRSMTCSESLGVPETTIDATSPSRDSAPGQLKTCLPCLSSRRPDGDQNQDVVNNDGLPVGTPRPDLYVHCPYRQCEVT